MKKKLLSLFLLLSITAGAQTTLFEDSFEAYNDFIIQNIGSWITLDLDGSTTYADDGTIVWNNKFLPQAFIIFNPSVAGVTNAASGNELRNYDPKTGSKYAGSWAAVLPGDGVGGTGPNNDWLVSPPIPLGASDNVVSFWVKSMSSSYGLENYTVGVYTGSGVPAASSDFTLISGGGSLTAPFPNWEQKTFNLDAYANQTVRIGIHCVSVNRYFFMVDDFKVTTATLGTRDFFNQHFTIFPNPANEVLHLSAKNNTGIKGIQITDLNGRTVKKIEQPPVEALQLNVSDLTAGMYLITVQTNDGNAVSKFLKN